MEATMNEYYYADDGGIEIIISEQLKGDCNI